ncbi:GSCOCG00010200001-RA-CDS [Cotesia congregata]|nr:GSCOCG00010200001-RA-CDS [Cotesia congregata]
MTKLLLLVVVLCTTTNYASAKGFSTTKLSGFMAISQDLYSGISDTVKSFKQTSTKAPPDANNKLKKIDDATKGLGETSKKLNTSLTNFKEATDVIIENLDEIGGKVDDIHDVAEVMLRRLDKVVQNLARITAEFTKIPKAVTNKMEQMLNLILKQQATQQTMDNQLLQLWQHTTNIDTWYEKFLIVINPDRPLQQATYDRFYEIVTTKENDGMDKTIKYIHAMFTTGTGNSSIHDNILEFVNIYQKQLGFESKCDLQRSFQEQLRVIYNIVVVSELRVFMMKVFVHHRKRIETKSKSYYKNDLKIAVEESLTRMSGYLQAMKLATKRSSAEIFRCDPPNPVINDDVFRLDGLFGLYYFNVQQISSDCEIKDLKIIDFQGHVDSLDLTQSGAYVQSYRPRYQCHGRIHKCFEGGKRTFCEARLGTGKRYEWMSNKNTTYHDCNGRYIDTLAKALCADVICQCSEEGPESTATRAFNLRPQYSDVKKNKVVTNVKLRKKDNVVHIQIQQGILQAEGRVDEDSLEWVPLGKFIRSVSEDEEGFHWTDNEELWPLVEDQDYTYVAHDRAELNLDDILVETGYIVTGVKFERQNLNPRQGLNMSPLRLKVHGTKFNYVEGKLSIPTDAQELKLDDRRYFKWFNASLFDVETDRNYGRARDKISMEGKRDSMLSGGNRIDARPNSAVEFQPTNFDTDFGQTTIPYFDARPAIIVDGVALGGIALTHRGIPGYGGYVAPKVFSINHAEYIEIDIDDISAAASEIVENLRNEEDSSEEKTEDDLNPEDEN